MAAKTSTIRVNVIGDSKSAQKALRDVAGVGTNTQKQLSAVTAGIAAGFTAYALPAVKSFVGGFKSQAMAAQEASGKMESVFSSQQGRINAWAKDSINAFGLARHEALNYAGSFGNLLQSMGATEQQSAAMSMRLIELAADMAAFNDTSLEQALNAIQSGLAGETEPLKRFGVLLNETTLKQKALSMGLIQHTSGVLPPAIRMQAAYALIMEQTTRQQGTWEREAGNAAVAEKRFQAALKETQAQIGQALIPAYGALLNVARPLVSVMGDNADAVAAFGIALGTTFAANKVAGWVGTLTAVNTQTLTLRQSARLMNTTTVQLQSSMAKLAENINNGLTPSLAPGATRAVGGFTQSMKTMIASALSPTNLALMGVTVGVGLLTKAWLDSKQKAAEHKAHVDSITQAYFDQSGALDVVNSRTQEYIINQSRFGTRNQLNDLQRINVTYGQLNTMLAEGEDGLNRFADAAERGNEIQKVSEDRNRRLNEMYGDTRDKLGDLVRVGDQWYQGNTDLVESFRHEQKALADANREKIEAAMNTDALTEAEREQLAEVYESADASTNWAEVWEQIGPIMQKAGIQLDGVTGAVDEQRAAIEAEINALRGLHNALFGSFNIGVAIENAFDRFNSTMEGLNKTTGRGSSRTKDLADQTEKLADAQERAEKAAYSHQKSLEDLEEAQRGVEEAQKALDEALQGPSARDRQEADMDLKDAQLALEDATERVIDAQDELTAAQAEGDPSKIRRAQNDYEQALLARERAQLRLNDAQEAYNKVANWTAQNDPKVAAAQDGVKAAQDRLEQATRNVNERLREMEKAQRDVNDLANYSPHALYDASMGMLGHRDTVLEAKNAYVGLNEELKRTMEELIALDVTKVSASKKIEHLNAIRQGIMSNPYLNENQKRSLLDYVNSAAGSLYSQRASEIGFTPGFMPFAEGGVIRGGRGGVPALIGEKSHDELVLPLTKDVLSKLGGGGPTNIYNVTVQAQVVKSDAELGRVIVQSLEAYNKRNGRRAA